MPELTPTGAVDQVERQVRRVRRRKNLFELQRTLYLAIGAAAIVATVLLPLALFAPADLFAIAAWSALAVLLGLALILIGATRRRWLARARAVSWIETKSALAGRLRTLLELRSRPSGFFHALLMEQVGAGLDAWAPRRLVPRRVPRAALASAVIAVAVLAVVIRFASLASPTAPPAGFVDQPFAAERGTATERDPTERSVVAPGVPSGGNDRAARGTAEPRREPSPLTRLSSTLQENVRQQVWGKAWERVREALARAGTSGGSERAEDGEVVDTAETGELDVARAPSNEVIDGPGGAPPAEDADDETNVDPETDAATDTADAEEREGGSGAGGAGNGSSPNDLFDGERVATDPTHASFELSLAARMRSDRAGPGQPKGPPPPADRDARPALASEQRRETAAHRMAVPAAYEHVVREVFAHREAP